MLSIFVIPSAARRRFSTAKLVISKLLFRLEKRDGGN